MSLPRLLWYVADAPLTMISAAYRAGSAVVRLGSGLQELSARLQVAQRCFASDASSIVYLQEEVALLSAQVGKLVSPPMHWVRNCESGVVHRPIFGHPENLAARTREQECSRSDSSHSSYSDS